MYLPPDVHDIPNCQPPDRLSPTPQLLGYQTPTAGRCLSRVHRSDARSTKVQTLLDVGIRTFINLTESGETNHDGELFVSYETLVNQLCPNTCCMRFPVRDLWVPVTVDMRRVLDAIDGSLNRKQPVYVHCWGGVGRTGTVIACWLLRHGLASIDNVGDVLAELRTQDTERGHRPWPESAKQREFLARWEE